MAYSIPRVASTGSLSTTSIVRDIDGAVIPRSEENTDYRKFLVWQAAGNTIATMPPIMVVPTPNFLSYVDNTRSNKLLSVEMATLQFYGGVISSDDYLLLHSQTQATASYVLPYDATLVRMSLFVGNTHGNTATFSIYRDGIEAPNAATVSSNPAMNQRIVTDLDIDVDQQQLVRLRLRGATGISVSDIVASLFVRWRSA